MSILTLDALRRNPWKAVDADLPANPGPLLLKAAYFASYYCRSSERLLLVATRRGSYTPLGWPMREDDPDLYADGETRSLSADQRLNEICELYANAFGEPLIL